HEATHPRPEPPACREFVRGVNTKEMTEVVALHLCAAELVENQVGGQHSEGKQPFSTAARRLSLLPRAEAKHDRRWPAANVAVALPISNWTVPAQSSENK